MPSSSLLEAPQWVTSLYASFPLVTLDQHSTLNWKREANLSKSAYTLWVHPPSLPATHPHYSPWASSSPASLRAQLLFLLRSIPVRMRPWHNETAAPNGTLPTLHLTKENRLVAANDIRVWLDTNHPLRAEREELQGMEDQEAYDRALAIAQLVLTRLLPAYLASTTETSEFLANVTPLPPPLSAGLTTPLPASLTGDARLLDREELVHNGLNALEALSTTCYKPWALGTKSPTPLDALIASHLYCIYGLPQSSLLRSKLEESTVLGSYVDNVLERASGTLLR